MRVCVLTKFHFKKLVVTEKVRSHCPVLFFQKEALKGKTDGKENGGEKMETEKSEEKGTSEEKA